MYSESKNSFITASQATITKFVQSSSDGVYFNSFFFFFSLTWTTRGLRSCLLRGFLCLGRKRSDCICKQKYRMSTWTYRTYMGDISIRAPLSWCQSCFILRWWSQAAVWRPAELPCWGRTFCCAVCCWGVVWSVLQTHCLLSRHL